MESENTVRFQGEITYSVAALKETNRGHSYFSPRFYVPQIVLTLCFSYLTWSYSHFVSSQTSLLLLLIIGLYWVGRLIHFLKNRNGGIQYKRMLSSNGGKPVHHILRFSSDAVHITLADSGNQFTFQYSQIHSVAQTKNYIILVMEHRQFLPIHKDSLRGGTKEEFIAFLFSVCPNLRPKRMQSNLPGQIAGIALILASVIGVIVGICTLPFVQRIIAQTRPINNTMSFQQIASAMEAYDIHIPQQAVADAQEAYESFEVYIEELGINIGPYNKALSLLSYAGYSAWEDITYGPGYSPTCESGVIWMDTEAWYPETMYSDLLYMISALDPQSLDFTHIQQDNSKLNWETGTGTQSVTFRWNGQSYQLDADAVYDWYDLSVLDQLSDIVSTDDKKLYFTGDDGQGLLIFYRSPQWAKEFQRATGITLEDETEDIRYLGY